MDPNATLKHIRELVDQLNRQIDDSSTPHVDTMDAVALVEYIEALDQWLSRGGFLPREWESKCPDCSHRRNG